LIELEQVTFEYKDNGFALQEINLKIKEGEFLSILGPNGSGKSTLLKIISGELQPSKGLVKFNGQEVGKIRTKERAKKMAFVSQNATVVYPFTVYEIVAMGRTPYLNFLGYEKKRDSEIVHYALQRMGIEHLAGKSITHISGGEAQRAFIARALAQEPDVILLDEANAHLDVKHQISIYKTLKELNEQKGITVVFVSHDFNLPARFSERVMLLTEGTIFKDGTIKNILTEENIKTVFDVNIEILQRENSIDILLRI
jgi:iron complex transport system ATP-binding protein